MSVHEYDYHLPSHLIAQTPAARRDAARMLVLDRTSPEYVHAVVADLPHFLQAGDFLVLNNTRVLHARLRTVREATGGKVELLLLAPLADGEWEAMARPSRRLHDGERLRLSTGVFVEVRRRTSDGLVVVALPNEVSATLDQHGELPLPPYIRGYEGDTERYQTVYSCSEGSVAAPTAGLHFTEELLTALQAAGVLVRYITLHVGVGTFKPVQVERVEDHRVHSEPYFVPVGLLDELETARAVGHRVVAVGTTTARSLESAALCPGAEGSWQRTDIFIRPGHEWRLVDGLLTNFHLPRSSLLMLVSALAGQDRIRQAYEEAIRQGYRFYSFGDAMLIL
ncbi:MAG: tRNA preQ1(34) S-adenosylmethionine ribosyltransferase-isomerase QueA [Chloroflexota bacterium]|nr:tRNA preQ1(34) S-adenosylmethionine ribosyltransferase-isomerase QueA [Chloroflexota bacterium]